MRAISISPLLLLGADPERSAEAVDSGIEAAERIRQGHRVIVPTPAVLMETLLHLGAGQEEARGQILSHLAPRDDLGGLPEP